MIKLSYYGADTWPEYGGWLERGLRLTYNYDLIPEQRDVPFEYALQDLHESTEGCSLVVVHNTDDDTFVLCVVIFGQTSQHILGYGTLFHVMVGNGTPQMCLKLVRYVKHLSLRLFPAHEWMNISKRIGRYKYLGTYYKLGVPNGQED